MTDEIAAIMKDLTQKYGAYKVAKVLHEVSAETSREYAEAGNDGAIIHVDARELGFAVNAMKRAHPLRAYE